MFTFIVSCIIAYSFYKHIMNKANKINTNYKYNSSSKFVPLPKPHTFTGDSTVKRAYGKLDYYVNKEGEIFFEGVFLPNKYDFNYFCSHSSVLSASIEHMGETMYEDDNGYYTAITTINTYGKHVPLSNYFYYTPTKCQICGSDIPRMIRPLDYKSGSDIYTGDLSDSFERYCPHCLARLRNNTETFYPFYIDTLNKKLITTKDCKKFRDYMDIVYDVKHNQAGIHGVNVSDEFESTPYYSDICRFNVLDEYKKNEHIVDMWQTIKDLR